MGINLACQERLQLSHCRSGYASLPVGASDICSAVELPDLASESFPNQS